MSDIALLVLRVNEDSDVRIRELEACHRRLTGDQFRVVVGSRRAMMREQRHYGNKKHNRQYMNVSGHVISSIVSDAARGVPDLFIEIKLFRWNTSIVDQM